VRGGGGEGIEIGREQDGEGIKEKREGGGDMNEWTEAEGGGK